MSKARELAELSRTVSDSADAVAITIDSSEDVSFSEDIKLGDGKKAIFGASSDLSIYHDGSASFISDQGTGHLKILAGDFRVNNAADNAQFISAVNGAEVNLYHNNALKLATTSTGITVGNGSGSQQIYVDAGAGWADLKLNSDATNGGSIYFNDGADAGQIWYYHPDNTMRFHTDGTEAFRLTAAQDMYFGQTSGSAADVGIILQAAGNIFSTVNGGTSAYFRRNTSEGEIIRLSGGSTTVGSIGVDSTRLTIGSAGASGLRFDGANVMPMSSGSLSNGTVDIGYSANRFRDIYLTGGINFNGSSGGINTANRSFLMDEYEIGTCTIGFSTNDNNSSTSRLDNTTGYYQKTGNICTVHFYSGGITFSAAGTGYSKVTGLPFNGRAGTYNYGAAVITHNTATTTDVQNGYTVPNQNFFILTQRLTTSHAVWVTGGVRYFMFSVTYLTN